MRGEQEGEGTRGDRGREGETGREMTRWGEGAAVLGQHSQRDRVGEDRLLLLTPPSKLRCGIPDTFIAAPPDTESFL